METLFSPRFSALLLLASFVFASHLRAELITGQAMQNPFFTGNNYSGWKLNAPWRNDGINNRLVFDIRSSNPTGFPTAISQGVDLMTQSVITNAAGGYSALEARLMDFNFAASEPFVAVFGGNTDDGIYKLFFEVDVMTSSGLYRAKSQKFDTPQNLSGPLDLNFSWQTGGAFLGDLAANGGTLLSEISSITYKAVMFVDTPASGGTAIFTLENMSLEYIVDTLPISKAAIGKELQKFENCHLAEADCVDGAILAGLDSLAEPPRKPNVVLILADDMGYSDAGFNGCIDIPTPNLDALAQSGIRFTQGYVSASVCGPSRAGLLTGRYQQRFGCGENPPEAGWPDNARHPDAGVPLSESLLSELLQPAGYQAGVIGKWHLGLREELRPSARGFDYFYGFLNGAHSYVEAKKTWGASPDLWPVFRNSEPLDYTGYLTDTFTDEGIGFIERNKSTPFFLYMSYNAVHSPWQVPANVAEAVQHIENPDRRTYAGMLVSMDNGIGRIIQALKDNGVYEHTLVIFLSDNGAPKDSAASSAPLRGNKSDTYEGGIRVPFVMSWPNGLPAGQTYKLPVSSLDLAPTITALAGAPAPAQGYDGVDLMPYLCGEKKGRPHEIMYWRRDSDYAIRVEDWKLAWNDGRPNGTRTSELFNLADDPNEKTDLIKQYPEKATNLQKMFDDWDSKLPDNEWWGGPANRKR